MKSPTNLLLSLATILFLIANVWWFTQDQAKSGQIDPSKTVFFFGNTCVHCQATEKWFEENQIGEKIQFERKEISSPVVQAELQQAVGYCSLDASQGIGVPFLFAEGKCYMGSPQVEGYFQQKLNLK